MNDKIRFTAETKGFSTNSTVRDFANLDSRLRKTKSILGEINNELSNLLSSLRTAGKAYKEIVAAELPAAPSYYLNGKKRPSFFKKNPPQKDFEEENKKFETKTGQEKGGPSFAGEQRTWERAQARSSESARPNNDPKEESTFKSSNKAGSPGRNAGQTGPEKSSEKTWEEKYAKTANRFGGSESNDKKPDWKNTRNKTGQFENGEYKKTAQNSGSNFKESYFSGKAQGSGGPKNGQQHFSSASGESAQDRYRRWYESSSSGSSSSRSYSSGQRSSTYNRANNGSGNMTLARALEILNLRLGHSLNDIQNAYRKKARECHPDLGGDEELMKNLNLAYEIVLRNKGVN